MVGLGWPDDVTHILESITPAITPRAGHPMLSRLSHVHCCFQVGRPTMMAKERAVAVRSLLVSTATEKPDVALQKAIDDIERYRRIH